MQIRNPESRAEWQEAADAAYGFIALESARQYGLVTGGPKVDVDRCEEILREAKRRNIEPSRDCVERLAKELSGAAT